MDVFVTGCGVGAKNRRHLFLKRWLLKIVFDKIRFWGVDFRVSRLDLCLAVMENRGNCVSKK